MSRASSGDKDLLGGLLDQLRERARTWTIPEDRRFYKDLITAITEDQAGLAHGDTRVAQLEKFSRDIELSLELQRVSIYHGRSVEDLTITRCGDQDLLEGLLDQLRERARTSTISEEIRFYKDLMTAITEHRARLAYVETRVVQLDKFRSEIELTHELQNVLDRFTQK